MTQQLTHQQIAWRVAQDLPRGAYVRLGAGMPLLVPDYVANGSGIEFAQGIGAGVQRENTTDVRRADYYIVGAREVAQNGDLVDDDEPRDASRTNDTRDCIAHARHVLVMTEFFARDGRPKLVPQCSSPPNATQCVTTLYTDIAVVDLRDGKAWLREIIEGITLHVLQAETDVQLHVAPDLRLLQAAGN